MTESQATVTRLVGPVLAWLTNGGDAWEMDLAYWNRRRELMDEGELMGYGPEMKFLSNIDTAMDVFRPDADGDEYQIDEAQLREKIAAAVAGLRRLGYLADS